MQELPLWVLLAEGVGCTQAGVSTLRTPGGASSPSLVARGPLRPFQASLGPRQEFGVNNEGAIVTGRAALGRPDRDCCLGVVGDGVGENLH